MLKLYKRKDRVARYMPRVRPGPPRSPSTTWATFVRLHVVGSLAIDFPTELTATLGTLPVFARRSLVHDPVTAAELRCQADVLRAQTRPREHGIPLPPPHVLRAVRHCARGPPAPQLRDDVASSSHRLAHHGCGSVRCISRHYNRPSARSDSLRQRRRKLSAAPHVGHRRAVRGTSPSSPRSATLHGVGRPQSARA
jgi:hypothetical protein